MKTVASTKTTRSAYTLMELDIAMTAMTILLAGMSSAIFIAGRAASPIAVPANTLTATTEVQEIASELRFATRVRHRGPNVVEFTRQRSGSVDRIRYFWSGTPADPLQRQLNNSAITEIVENVYLFDLLYSTRPTPNANPLINADLEDGTTGWESSDGAAIVANTAQFHGGATSLHVISRPTNLSGVEQEITGAIASGAAYDIEVWVKRGGAQPIDIVPVIRTESVDSVTQDHTGGSVSIGDAWTKVSVTITPTWTGTLNAAYLKIKTSSGTSPFYVDDVSIRSSNFAYVTRIGIALQVGKDAWSRVQTAVPILNAPVVASP